MAGYTVEKKRIIFNADFKHSVQFFQKQYEIMKELEKDLPDFALDGLNFIMEDKTNHFSELFTFNKMVFEYDDINNKTTDVKEKILNGMNVYNKFVPIEKFTRLGLRVFMFIPMEKISIEEIADLLKGKLYANGKEIEDIFSNKVRDMAYLFDYTKDGYSINFKCGPMPKEHIPIWVNFGDHNRRFKSNKEIRDYVDAYPAISIFMDIDCFKVDVLFKDKEDYLSYAFNEIAQTASKINKLILG